MIASIRRFFWRIRGVFAQATAASCLAAVCVVVFIVLRVAERTDFAYGYTYGHALVTCFGLNWTMFISGFFWQPLTYLFLHVGWWHLTLNLLTMVLLGSSIEREVGRRHFWRLFIFGGIVGGLGWLGISALLAHLPLDVWLTATPTWFRTLLGGSGDAVEPWRHSLCIGASGGVFAFIGAFAALFPRREVYVLLVVFPLRLRALTLAWILVVISLGALLLTQSQIAHAAHLSGGLMGYWLGRRLRPQMAIRNQINWGGWQ